MQFSDSELPILGLQEEEDVLTMNSALPDYFRQSPEQAVYNSRVQKHILMCQGKKSFGPDTDDYSVSKEIIYGDNAVNAPLDCQREERSHTPVYEEAHRHPFNDDCSPVKRRKIDDEWKRLDRERDELNKQRVHLAQSIKRVADALNKVSLSLLRPQRNEPPMPSILDMLDQQKPKQQPRPTDLSYRPPQPQSEPQSEPKPKPQPQPQLQPQPQPQPNPQLPKYDLPPIPDGWTRREWKGHMRSIRQAEKKKFTR